MLEAVGVGQTKELVYRALLSTGSTSLSALAFVAEIDEADAERALDALESKGLVSRVPGIRAGYVPAPPDVAFEDLISKRREELESAEFGVLQLAREFRNASLTRNPADLIEVVSGRAAVRQRCRQLQEGSDHEVLMLCKPPFASSTTRVNLVEQRLITRGVRYRVIYDGSLLDDPIELEHLRHHAANGEDAAVMKDLPMKLTISDRRMALLPLTTNDPNIDESAVVVHASTMLDALVALFERLWERAARVRPGLETMSREVAWMSNADLRLLELLATGLKDEAIARHLGVAVRTVRRRVHKLIDELGASSRFQAGIQAAKRGWI